ncbi:cell division protein ZapE [Vibrio rhizosphaerae]|uniref:Cell division protein ZapE n=1 Tax=Vibrio rhizosphaerae TaxID=398736 RepID=A0ABU4IWJ7_9VIBR|nr:cell division protein ZapE [Vibrio rhizosphaerae]MDW6093780.1 cell division protein ZapE [Vibrio rhizosphaerae]
MTPRQRYDQDLKDSNFQKDDAQLMAVDALDDLYHRFLDYQKRPIERESLFTRLLRKKAQSPVPPKGIYFWGGVGRGKTYLMDTFYESLPTQKKMRVHFHRFMYRVHEELKQLHHVNDPLEIVADKFSAETEIICFDEFFVSDITDAMILGTLFQALFARNIVLVATSNIPPDDLYRNGLQRARFLPAIELIKTHCLVMNVDSGIDYRLRTLEQADIYHFPNDEQSRSSLESYYRQLISHESDSTSSIAVNHRQIPVLKAGHGVLFATFAQLCQSMRSQNDYIELSRLYHTVLLADVKQMNATMDDAARRFIALVDEFYERHVKLIISAEVALDRLYQGGLLAFEFQRCRSRLIEMQSREYLLKEHLS